MIEAQTRIRDFCNDATVVGTASIMSESPTMKMTATRMISRRRAQICLLVLLPLLLLLLSLAGQSQHSYKETIRIHRFFSFADASIHSTLSRRILRLPLCIALHHPDDHEEHASNTNLPLTTSHTEAASRLWQTKSGAKAIVGALLRGGAANSSGDGEEEEEDDDDDVPSICSDVDDVDDEEMDETNGDDGLTQSSPSEQRPSRLSVIRGPFRMNELATYEASLEDNSETAYTRTTASTGASPPSPTKEGDSPPSERRYRISDEQSNDKNMNKYPQEKHKPKTMKKRTKKEHSHQSSQHHHGTETNDAQKKPATTATKNIGNGVAPNQRGFFVGGGAVTATRDTESKKDPSAEKEDLEPSVSSPLPDASMAKDSTGETAAKKSSQNDISDVANLWWVNMWMQQLSDRHSDDEDDGAQNDDDLDELDDQFPPDVYEERQFSVDDEDMDEQPLREDETGLASLNLEQPDGKDYDMVDLEGDFLSETTVAATGHPATQDSANAMDTFVSSGAWVPIDNLITLGLASKFAFLRVSRRLRPVRKWTARVTGLHGVLSGKPSLSSSSISTTKTPVNDGEIEMQEKDLQAIQKRIAAIDKAREGVERARAADEQALKRRGLFGGLFRGRDYTEAKQADDKTSTQEEEELPPTEEVAPSAPQKSPEEAQEELERMQRVRQIDQLIAEGQARLKDLICEKDVLQRRPNPLFDYTTTETITTEIDLEESTDETFATNISTSAAKIEIHASRKMKFPPDDLVAEYLEMMISTRRLTKMNHTYLWKESETDDDEEETIGDDLFTPSADARRLYEDTSGSRRSDRGNNGNGNGNGRNGNGGGGSWLLRQSIGNGPSLGEKIGQAAEAAAYKAVCAALMSFLARTLSSLHGINVLKHSDIRLVLEQAPDLPPVGKDGVIPGSSKNYAEETIKTVMRSKARRTKKRSKYRMSEDSFVQRDAVTEMLLSHVQISAPLLKLFPLAWQRALLGNILTLATAVISDFVDGLYFQILGHQLSFAFRPITEEDMVQHFRLAGGRFNNRRHRPAEFEAAVRATAEDVSEELKFLDRWHERALGSGVLRTQIANMIARIVLTLTDEVLSGARMDLWSAQAGGPRMLASLEYRAEGE